MSNELTIAAERPSAVSIIQSALSSGVSPEHLRELLAVRREWDADEARKAFNLSVSEFQRRAPIVEKGDKAYDKDYARLDRIWRTVRPLVTELGLSVTWQICELRDGVCHIEGQLRHRDGHGEKLTHDIPVPELLKGQNKAQQMGSASTYAKRYAMCAALGIVTGDDLDDDGHAAGSVFVTEEQAEELHILIESCRGINDFNLGAFWGWVGCKEVKQISSDRYEQVKAQLRKKLKEANK